MYEAYSFGQTPFYGMNDQVKVICYMKFSQYD